MSWAHLPNTGVLYDQHPQFLEDITLIFSRRAIYERNKQAIEAEKQAYKQRGGR